MSTASLLEVWTRPVLILICAMLLFNLPTLLYKMTLCWHGVMFLLLCKDKVWKKPTRDPGPIFAKLLKESPDKVQKKYIYFVRHGESTWNDTFNKGKHRSELIFVLGFFPNLIKAVLYELYLLLSGKMDSWFYDSPLSELGLSQVADLYKFLRKSSSLKDPQHVAVAVLRNEPGAPSSKLVCSNLRRALSTTIAAFSQRLLRGGTEKILILPCLQEISRNPDALSITPAYTPITESWLEQDVSWCNFANLLGKHVDVSLHSGNKSMESNGLLRMQDFCRSVFESIPDEHIIVGGHSLWFRSFFQTFLPYQVDLKAKKKKMVNCGVVRFELLKYGGDYMIDPKTVQVVYGGFS